MKVWLINTFLLAFAVYWISNLFLWYPWSYNATLGMVLMLTASPLIWAYTIYLALITFPKDQLIKGTLTIAIVFLFTAVVFDYIFFGIIRNAMVELYHPTTLYGYGFLLLLPFIIYVLFKKKIISRKRKIQWREPLLAMSIGLFCLATLTLIIMFDLRIT